MMRRKADAAMISIARVSPQGMPARFTGAVKYDTRQCSACLLRAVGRSAQHAGAALGMIARLLHAIRLFDDARCRRRHRRFSAAPRHAARGRLRSTISPAMMATTRARRAHASVSWPAAYDAYGTTQHIFAFTRLSRCFFPLGC